MTKTLYLSDLDGTLLDRRGSVPAETAAILNRLIGEGLCFSYATARGLSSASLVTRGLAVSAPVVVHNGVFLMDPVTGARLHKTLLPEDAVPVIHVLAKMAGVTPVVYSLIHGQERVSYVTGSAEPGLQWYLNNRREDKRFRPLECETGLWDGTPYYVTCIAPRWRLAPIAPAAAGLDGVTTVFQQELYRPEWWLEMMPANGTKAQGARRLAKLLGCDRIVAFGDGKNDLSLFAAADECYAVENAVPELKAMATGIIGGSEASGVARFLERRWEEERPCAF